MCNPCIPPARSLFTVLLLLLFTAAAAAAAGDAETVPDNLVTVIATIEIKDGNIASAKQAAVKAALAAAVDQGAISLFAPEAIAGEFKRYSAAVAGNAEAFIDRYKILGESAGEGHYRVLVEAAVSLDQLKARVTAAAPAVAAAGGPSGTDGRPRILFLLSEQGIQDISPRFWWGEHDAPEKTLVEAAIAARAARQGFAVIAHGSTPPDVPVKAAIIFQPELDNRDAAEIGRRMGADVVIVGKGIVYAVADTGAGGDPAYNATITVRAVRTDNGQEITSGFETAVRQAPSETEGSREALKAAGLQAADHLIPSIASAWEDIIHPTEDLTLRVHGTGNLGNFVRFRQGLRGIPGVRDLQVRETNADEALIAVRFEGNAQDLRKNLLSNTFELFVIEVLALSNKGLDIALVPK